MYRNLCRVGIRSGLFSWLAHRNRGGVAILMYHGLRTADAPTDLTEQRRMHPPVAECRPQMEMLRRERFAITSLSAAVRGLAGEGPLPPRPVVITFDDGYLSTYTKAWPLWRELGV